MMPFLQYNLKINVYLNLNNAIIKNNKNISIKGGKFQAKKY